MNDESDGEVEEVPFVAEDGDADEPALPEIPESPPPPPEPPGFFGRTWPLFAACALVAATLAAVYVLLHPRAGAAASDPGGAPAFVTVDGTKLRREAAADAEELATLSAGSKVAAFGAKGPWLEVEADSGSRGFVPADSLERAADREARERRQKTLLGFAPVYGVVGEPADVTLAPYPLAARGGRLAKGAVIAIHSVDHSYFAFADKTWGLAFVASSAVDLIPPDPRQPAIVPEKVKPLKNLTIIDLEGEPPPLDEEALEDAEEEAARANAGSDSEAAAAPPVPSPSVPGLVEGPVVIKRVDPVYPDLARRAGIEGTVELEVSIDASGDVTEVEVVRGLPLGLSEAAADALHKWKYKPARSPSGPVATRKSVRIRFVLSSQ
jgi:protein TonB